MATAKIGSLEALAENGFFYFSRLNSIEKMFQECLEQVCTCMNWAVGHLLVPSQEAPCELISAPLWYVKDRERFDMFRQVTKALRFTKGVGLPGQVLSTGNPVWIADIRHTSSFTRSRLTLDAGLLGILALPVKHDDRIIAVLEFISENSLDLDSGLMETMNKIGLELGHAVGKKMKEENTGSNLLQAKSLIS